MFGFQNYPTSYADVNFRKMRRVMARYPSCDFGYADHCLWNEPHNLTVSVMGAAAGMQYVEKHVTTRPGEERCDWQAAISIDQLNRLREQLDVLERCQGNGSLELNAAERQYSRNGLMKAIALAKVEIAPGTPLDPSLLEFKRSDDETDLSPLDIARLVGSALVEPVSKGQPLQRAHFEDLENAQGHP